VRFTALKSSQSFDLEITSAYMKKRPQANADNGAVDEEIKTCLGVCNSARRPWLEMPRRHPSDRITDPSGNPLLMERQSPWTALSVR
jgi:hypothetical protein